MKKIFLILILTAAMALVTTTGMVFAADKDLSSGYTFKYDTNFEGDLPGDDFFDGTFYAEEGKPFVPKLTLVNSDTGDVVPDSAYDVTYYDHDTKETLTPPFVVDSETVAIYPIAKFTAKSGSGYTGTYEHGFGISAKHWIAHFQPFKLVGDGVEPVYEEVYGYKFIIGYDVQAGKIATPETDFYGRSLDLKYFSVGWYEKVDDDKTIDPSRKLSEFPHKEGDYLFVLTGKAPYHGQIAQDMHIVGSVDEAPAYPSQYDTGSGNEPSENPIKVSGKKPTVKYARLKKKTQTIKASSAFSVKNAIGNVTYKVKTYDKKAKKKITVSSSGKVTVKKGLKKGKYTLKVNVTDKGGAGKDGITYKPKTVTVTLKVTVK